MEINLLLLSDKQLHTDLLNLHIEDPLHLYYAADHEAAVSLLKDGSPNIAILDAGRTGFTASEGGRIKIFDYIIDHSPHCLVILMISEQAKKKINEDQLFRAFDIFEKPVNLGELRSTINRAMHKLNLISEIKKHFPNLGHAGPNGNIIGQSRVIKHIKRTVQSVADTSASVLITGESGTGKEVVARAIHEHSAYKFHPFVIVNAGAIPDSLLESELFGYERGAFTGAVKSKPGKFELAQGGTIFLDEIGSMSPFLQCKILRAIENREIERLGATHITPLNVRIIAATNKDLCRLIKRNQFREDLYYRLNVIKIYLPPLRDRMDDLPVLADHFLKKFTLREQKDIRTISLAAMEILEVYSWPGNVRELEHVIERATILCNTHQIDVEHLPPEIAGNKFSHVLETHKYTDAVNEFKKLLIARTMEDTDYNKTKTARKLGLNRTYLFKLIKELELD